jgi:hypothetical protein
VFRIEQRATPKISRRDAFRSAVDDLFIVGLDAEWQKEGSSNRLLSFQWSVLFHGREHTGIAFYANGERPELSDLVQQILKETKSAGIFSHYPKQLFLVSHYTLAELSILEDSDKLKSRFDAIRGSFTTLLEPFFVKVTDEIESNVDDPNQPRLL